MVDLDFPYKAKFYDPGTVWEKAKREHLTSIRILDLPPRNLPYGYQYCYGKSNGLSFVSYDSCYEVDLLTDLFTEPARMQASRKGKISPLEYYQRNRENLLKHYSDPRDLREHIYDQKLECNSFKLTLACTIFKFFNAKRVLDGSAGWGDRILGAHLANVPVYVGFDPNPLLQPGYQKILEFINRPNYHLENTEFLQARVSGNYDLFFTSPPFYDYEIYHDDSRQSIHGRSLRSWLDDFMFPYLRKAYHLLDQNGYLVLYMSDTPDAKYMAQIDFYLRSIGAKFLGIIGTGLASRINDRFFPLWVWQKT